MTTLHLISRIFSFALLPRFALHATSPPMCLPSIISVRLPFVIHFTCLPFIFGTPSRISFAPRPPSGYSRVVFLGTYVTSIMILLDAPESLWSLVLLWVALGSFSSTEFCCCHCASRIMYYVFAMLMAYRHFWWRPEELLKVVQTVALSM